MKSRMMGELLTLHCSCMVSAGLCEAVFTQRCIKTRGCSGDGGGEQLGLQLRSLDSAEVA